VRIVRDWMSQGTIPVYSLRYGTSAQSGVIPGLFLVGSYEQGGDCSYVPELSIM